MVLRKTGRPRPLQPASPTHAPGGTSSPSRASGTTCHEEKRKAGHAETKEPLAKQLLRFRSYQTGLDIFTGGYWVKTHIAAGTQGDVFQGLTCPEAAAEIGVLQGKPVVALKRARNTNLAIQRHVVQEFAAVFHARDCYRQESGDVNSSGHPNIVGYLDWFVGQLGADREVWLVMERCEFALNDVLYTALQARTIYEKRFAEMVAQQRPPGAAPRDGAAKRCGLVLDAMLYRCPEREVVKVMLHMLTALAFLNRHGILHRDVKTENILWVAPEAHAEAEGVYKLADFGTAVVLAEGETARRDQDCGTLWTMAPEVVGRRPHSCNCDVWSLGCVAFEVATLERPFNSKELLAYKNTQDAAHEGTFWPALCASLAPLGVAAGAGGGGGGVASGPVSPSSNSKATAPPSTRRAATPSAGRKESRSHASIGTGPPPPKAPKGPPVARQASLPSLPSPARSPPLSPSSAAPSPPLRRPGRVEPIPDAPAATLGLGGPESDCSLPPLQSPSSGARRPCAANNGGGGDLTHSSCAEKAAAAEVVSSSPVMADKKRRFLRKRCNGRWGYSDDLRSLIFEDMLDEDASRRPCASELLERNSKALKLFAKHGFIAEGDESCSPRPAASAQELSANEACLIDHPLREITPEAFLKAMREEQQRLREEAEAKASRGRDSQQPI